MEVKIIKSSNENVSKYIFEKKNDIAVEADRKERKADFENFNKQYEYSKGYGSYILF